MWDSGNEFKNLMKHNITNAECEQVFFNQPVIVFDDTKHSSSENRWYLLGRTDQDRHLFIVFTIRKNLVRVISSRDMNNKEREIYNEEVKKDS
ncbi:MAG: BrnT family toxin [Ignavibacteriota bacterium]